ncbi:uncharacterized protein LOC114255979 [Camellia sinensis]|uniref:uncharacterized protein LOC114255979 n=1 Tax=Camellia sinensis TaxID=4442 RepID=UPI0010358A92|nr:uncharacterized protein LOC114255979 [Camellia sinensis]
MKNARNVDENESPEVRLARLERMVELLTEALRQQQNQHPPPPPSPPPPVQPELNANDDVISLIQKFNKIKPPTFQGGLEPLKAEAWILEIQKLFEVFLCSKEAFYDKYFPQCVRDRKVFEFGELKQGNMSMAEYEEKFTALARYAPRMVDTDYKKARKLDGGLNAEILDRINVLKLLNCGKVGHIVKDCPLASQGTSRPVASAAASTATPKPNLKATERETLRQDWVFALVPGDVQNTEIVVLDILPICAQNAYVLIDSRSTHSFVLHAFSQKLNRPLEPMNFLLVVSSPAGGSMTCAYVYPACEIIIGDVVLYVDLLPLNLDHFDVILGMDWLTNIMPPLIV